METAEAFFEQAVQEMLVVYSFGSLLYELLLYCFLLARTRHLDMTVTALSCGLESASSLQ